MLRLRLKIIENILKTGQPDLVEKTIHQILSEETEKQDPAFQLSQLMNNLKSDILFQLMSKQNHKDFKNLSEALRIVDLHKPKTLEEDKDIYP